MATVEAPADPPASTMVSIVIKSLNEEPHIAACIESALANLERLDGEVILADSGSTDRTIEIAARYPIRIVQLAEPRLRRCGVGPQLGFQFAAGRYVYVLDGDMELDRRFISRAMQVLEDDPRLAGVAGLVEEANAGNVQFRRRKRRAREGQPGPAQWLDMGGLYRSSALRSIGYLSNRNLHACEEQDLGLRLSSAGWKLRRLPFRGIVHHGHAVGSLSLQMRRLRSGYLLGPGEVLRSNVGLPQFWKLIGIHKHLIFILLLWLLLACGLALAPFTRLWLWCWLAALGVLLIERAIRYGSLVDALAIVAIWHVNAVALVSGFARRQVDPLTPVDAVVVADKTSGLLNLRQRDNSHAA